MKKTLTLSLFFHCMLLSAVFLFSWGSGTVLHEKVFVINLSEEPVKENNRLFIRKGEERSEKPAADDMVEVPVPEKNSVRDGTNNLIRKRSLETEVETAGGNRLHEEMKGAKELVAERADRHKDRRAGFAPKEPAEEVFSGEEEEMTVHAAQTASLGEDRGIFDDREAGAVPLWIVERIGRAIELVKTYPPLARRRGIEGTVRIGFSINPEGKPRDIEVIESSGYRVLDTATLRVVKKAAPYPYVDSRIEVPVTYRLRD